MTGSAVAASLVVSAGLPFNSTATWQTVTVSVPVTAGTDTVRATATTANGGPNLGAIMVVSPN